MEKEIIEWGYLYKLKVYHHLSGPPPEKTEKWIRSYYLLQPNSPFDDLEICDGDVKYKLVQMNYDPHTGGSLVGYLADLVFPWSKIR